MNWDAVSFDWNQARAFLATAEEGSLSAAARALGQTQPTLSRQVAGLEEDLGVALFERIGRTMVLTAPGHDLLSHVREMARAASRLTISALRESSELEGKVVVTTTNTMATYHLPGIVEKIRERAPRVELQIITSNEVQDITRREADIAIRHGRPEQPELVAKLLGEASVYLYASDTYIEKHGAPKSISDLAQCQIVGHNNAEEFAVQLQAVGMPVTRENFRLATANGVTAIEFVRKGLGLCLLLQDDAERFPELRRVLPELPLFTIPIWLVAHRELRTSSRFRLVFDVIAENIGSGLLASKQKA